MAKPGLSFRLTCYMIYWKMAYIEELAFTPGNRNVGPAQCSWAILALCTLAVQSGTGASIQGKKKET